MRQKDPHLQRIPFGKKILLAAPWPNSWILLFCLAMSSFLLRGQGSVSTTPQLNNNNGSAGVGFAVEANQRLILTGLDNIFAANANSANLWIRTGGLRGNPNSNPHISSANGWTRVLHNAPVTAANGNTPVAMDFGNNQITLNANQRYGFFIEANLRYQTGLTSDPQSFSDSVLTIFVEDSVAYGGPFPSPSYNPRRFLGRLHYQVSQIGNCAAFSSLRADSVHFYGAKIRWTPGAGNSGFRLDVGPTGFTQGTGQVFSGSYPAQSAEVILSNLQSNRSYDYYLTEYCNQGQDSTYNPSPRSFTTTKFCNDPFNFNANTLTNRRVQLSWNIASNPLQYEVLFGPQGLSPAQGFQSRILPGFQNTPIIGGLQAGFRYDFYLISRCDTNDFSDTIGPVSATFPYRGPQSLNCSSGFEGIVWEEDFETSGQWTGNIGAGNEQWQYGSGPPPSANTGPSGAHSGSQYLFFEASGSVTGATAEAISPNILVPTSPDSVELRFWLHAYGAAIGSLEIAVGNSSSGPFTPVFFHSGQIQTSQNDPWVEVGVDISAFRGQSIHLRLHYTKGSSFTGDLAIDHLRLIACETCPQALGPVTTQATYADSLRLQWPDTGLFELSWGPQGFNPNAPQAQRLSGLSSPSTISGLIAATDYEIYFRRICNGGDTSNWKGVYAATTLGCSPQMAPWQENFDDLTVWQPGTGFSNLNSTLDPCWQSQPELTQYAWGSGSLGTTSTNTGPDQHAGSGSGNFVFVEASNGAPNDVAYLYSPWIQWPAGENTELVYFYHAYGVTIDSFGVDANYGQGWQSLKKYFGQSQNSSTEAWLTDTAALDPAASAVRLRLWAKKGNGFTGDVAFDELSIQKSVPGDLNLISAQFQKNSPCPSSNDSALVRVHNLFGGSHSLAQHPLHIGYVLTGPVNSTGSQQFNSGNFPAGDTLDFWLTGLDRSALGSYQLSVWIDTNAVNHLSYNDSLLPAHIDSVLPVLRVRPDTTVLVSNTTDSVKLEALFPAQTGAFASNFQISEICHFRGSNTGIPTSSWPSYMIADDYIEISGAPNADLGGITLEQWSTTGLTSSHTFAPGTVLSPNGTAIIAVGQLGSSTPSPSDYYYHGNGSYTGSYGSGTAAGRVLKDPNGVMIDAVAYSAAGGYTFPAAAGVTAADWSGNTPSGSGTAGIRLEGPDLNDPTGWQLVSNTLRQDPNVLNANLVIIASSSPSQGNFFWSINRQLIDTLPQTYVGPYTAPGIYHYTANYQTACGTFVDTVTVEVNFTGCPLFTAPFVESFEDSSASATCWYNERVRGNQNWTRATGSSGGAITGAFAGQKNARFVSTIFRGDSTRFVSPIIDITPLSAPELNFWYAHEEWTGDQNHLHVYYRANYTDPWTRIFSDTTNRSAWTQATVNLPNPSPLYQIAFEGVNNFGHANVVDSVSILGSSPCPKPSQLRDSLISCTELQLDWQSASGRGLILFGPHGFIPGQSGSWLGIQSPPYLVDSLQPGMNYDFYLADTCANDTSWLSGPLNFQMPQGPLPQAGIILVEDSIINDSVYRVVLDGSATSGATRYFWVYPNGDSSNQSIDTAYFTSNGVREILLVAINPCGSDTARLSINVNISLSEWQTALPAQIFPNPSSGRLEFHLGASRSNLPLQLSLYDGQGRYIWRENHPTASGDFKRIYDFGHLAPGLYIFEAQRGMRRFRAPWILQNQ